MLINVFQQYKLCNKFWKKKSHGTQKKTINTRMCTHNYRDRYSFKKAISYYNL